ncbi:MAG: PAS domain-containing protein [Planctomycetota bacterium]
MIKPRVTPLNEPRPFEPHELFFSLTDPKGRIRSGNRVFARVSGYDESELIGEPHNLIRHPDVPRCVFKLLWDYLGRGETIAAYVKNLAADGRYYWVLAVVTPCEGGFLSVRLNPSTPLFDAAKKLYAAIVEQESRAEAVRGKQTAMEESGAAMTAALADAGFPTYDAFMRAALRAELSSRGEHVPHAAGDAGDEALPTLHRELDTLIAQLGEVFRSLDLFERLSAGLRDKHAAMEELGPSLSFLALNTHVSASRLGAAGVVLSVVSRRLGEQSKEAEQTIGALMERIGPACDGARAVAFDVEVAQIEAEVCESFVRELLEETDSQPHQRDESLRALAAELTERVRAVLDALERLADDIAKMIAAARDLVKQVGQMQIAQLNGRIEVASIREASGFATIFDDVATILGEARGDSDEIIALLAGAAADLEGLLSVEAELNATINRIAATTAEVISGPAELAIC